MIHPQHRRRSVAPVSRSLRRRAVEAGVDHAISNTGLVDLVFLVTSPVTDDVRQVDSLL
jgi:hypothetical protein